MPFEIPEQLTGLRLVYIVFYRLRTLTPDEKDTWFREWARIKKDLPKGLSIITEGFGAFGTSYTGFTIYEGPMESFRQHIETLERVSSHFVEKTETIIGTKGFNLPLDGMIDILEHRPVD